MNALAGVDTGTELDGMTLWSSHRPCLMCAAACEFTGVGAVVFIAPIRQMATRPGPGRDRSRMGGGGQPAVLVRSSRLLGSHPP